MPLITQLENKIEIERQKTSALLKITNLINGNFDIEDLLSQYKVIMKDNVGVGKMIFVNHSIGWNHVLQFGAIKKYTTEDYKQLQHFNTLACVQDLETNCFSEFDVFIPIIHKEKALSYLLIGGIGVKNLKEYKDKHNDFIQTITNIISVAIENQSLNEELINIRVAERDIELAASMQKMLFPRNLPHSTSVDVSATYIPKFMVSGDYYDFIRFSDTEYVFCIADVSGKGVSAALLMSNLQANFRANIKYNNRHLTLIDLVKELNYNVLDSAHGEKFITFFVGYFNEETRALKYINAGHNYPILKDKSGIKELLSIE